MPDIAELVEHVRLLIADTDEDHQVYEDFQIEQFLEIEAMHVKSASARALETYAAHIAQVVGPVRGLLDIRVGGEQSAKTLLAVARSLRTGGHRMMSMTMTNFPDSAQFGDMTL